MTILGPTNRPPNGIIKIDDDDWRDTQPPVGVIFGGILYVDGLPLISSQEKLKT